MTLAKEELKAPGWGLKPLSVVGASTHRLSHRYEKEPGELVGDGVQDVGEYPDQGGVARDHGEGADDGHDRVVEHPSDPGEVHAQAQHEHAEDLGKSQASPSAVTDEEEVEEVIEIIRQRRRHPQKECVKK